jgi:hypothetical protein
MVPGRRSPATAFWHASAAIAVSSIDERRILNSIDESLQQLVTRCCGILRQGEGAKARRWGTSTPFAGHPRSTASVGQVEKGARNRIARDVYRGVGAVSAGRAQP